MLILSRFVGEKIYIGDDIVIEVKLIDRGTVRLGLTAPRETKILRAELGPWKDPNAAPVKEIPPPR